MNTNIYDKVLSRVVDLVDKSSGNIAEKFKGSNPFDQVPLSMDEQIYDYNTMDSAKLQEYVNKYGMDEVEKWMGKVKSAMQKRGI